MNILFFSRSFYPSVGGVEKHIERISEVLIKKGHNVSVVTECKDLGNRNYEVYKGIKIYRIFIKNEKRKKFKIWKWLVLNRDLIVSSDIIHCHDVFYWYLPFKFIYPKSNIYITYHGYEGYPITVRAKFMRKLAELLTLGNICVGSFIQKWYGTEPNYVMYGGVDLEYKNQKYKKHSAIFIGRLDDQTGILTYASAVKKLQKYYNGFKFMIYGDGKFRKDLQKTYNIPGFKLNAEKEISKFHFAFVSRYLTILEALISKRLVFATYDNPLKKDYLTMTPFAKFIVIEEDPQKLVEKVKYYLNHPEEEKNMVEKGYNWAREQTWGKVANVYLDLWHK